LNDNNIKLGGFKVRQIYLCRRIKIIIGRTAGAKTTIKTKKDEQTEYFRLLVFVICMLKIL